MVTRRNEEGARVYGVCGRCKLEIVDGPIEKRHLGHCGSCGVAIFGNPPACPDCGQSFAPADPPHLRKAAR